MQNNTVSIPGLLTELFYSNLILKLSKLWKFWMKTFILVPSTWFWDHLRNSPSFAMIVYTHLLYMILFYAPVIIPLGKFSFDPFTNCLFSRLLNNLKFWVLKLCRAIRTCVNSSKVIQLFPKNRPLCGDLKN